MNKRIAICVPVYKHRTDKLLENLHKIRKDLDIYIVTQDNDPKIDEYNQFVGDNIKIMNTQATSIFEKREAIRNQVIALGYDGVIQIDDDILYTGRYISDETKRSTSNSYKTLPTTFEVILDKMLDTVEKENAGFVSFKMEFYLGFGKPGTVSVNQGLACGEFVYIDCHELEKHDIHYDTTGTIHEDVDLVLKLLQHGVKCVTINDYTCVHGNNYLGTINNSTLYSDFDTLYKFILNQYIKWHFPLNVGGKLKNKLSMRIPFRKMVNNFTYPEADPELLKLCEAQDVQGVIEYVRNKQGKK